jgi:hypothetical protein
LSNSAVNEQRRAPLALRLLPYTQAYKRNYVRHMTHRRAQPGGPDMKRGCHAITELTFANISDYERMVRDMSDPAIRDQVVSDEQRFLDRSATVVFMIDEIACC